MKTLTYALGTINSNQLHDQMLQTFPQLRGTAASDGTFKNPVLSVSTNATTLVLVVPDDAETSKIQALLEAYDATRERKVDVVSELRQTDADVLEVLEATVELLLAQHVLKVTDLPASVQTLWAQRQSIRQRLTQAV